MKSLLQPEDYVEPRCVLCDEPYGKEPEIKPIPQQRIKAKVDENMSRLDYPAVERTLLYWLEEAKLGRDIGGELMIRNELAGHYRKTGEKEKAYASAEEAVRLLPVAELADSISAGTTYVNAATVYNAFADNERSLELFEKAKEVYDRLDRVNPELLGGLYNNMGLTCNALGMYDRALELFDRAFEVMGDVPAGELEQGITLLNIADVYEKRDGIEGAEEKIFGLLDRAYELLTAETAADPGYAAYVWSKCAPSFSFYGYFSAAKDLNERAEKIYERT